MKYPTFIALSVFVVSFLPMHAATFTWSGAGSDTLFSNEDNWTSVEPGIPGTADLAQFNSAGAVTVTFDDDQTTNELRILGTMDDDVAPSVLFDLGGFTYTATAGGATQIMRPSGGNSPRTLILQNGELSLGGSNYWGHDGNSGAANNGAVVVRVQDDATLRLTAANYLRWLNNAGNTITVDFFVENGGRIVASDNVFDIGGNASGHGSASLSIIGPGSSFEAVGGIDRNVVSVGGGGDGTLSITEGASLTSDRAVNVAFGSASNGLLTVSGGHLDEVESTFTPSSITGNQFYIGGGRSRDRSADQPRAGGEGVAEFLDGGTGQFTTLINYHNSVANTKGTLRIDGGFVNITGTGTFEQGSLVELGLRSVSQDLLMTANNLLLDSTLQLLIDGEFSAALNDSIFLIEYTSLTGTFNGLAEGATIHQGGYSFSVHYAMGEDENIIGLTVIPEPHAFAALFGILCLSVCCLRRARNRA